MDFKKLTSITLFSLLTMGINAEIVISLPENCNLSKAQFLYAPIKQYANAKTRAERGIITDSVTFVNSKAVINIPDEPDSFLYGIYLNNNNVEVYATPDETVYVNILECAPFTYSLTGTELAEGMTEIIQLEKPIESKIQSLYQSGVDSGEEFQNLVTQYNNIQKEFIQTHPDNPAVAIALMNLDGEDFVSTYDAHPEYYINSILLPFIENQYAREKKNMALEKKQKELQEGEVEAPNFTLKNLEGKDISLKDFKGKWVILDFWGSWCPWCIKGFPELKEAFEKYSDNLVIIGIDCQESEADWRAGVAKYELPWVNVYNPADSNLLGEYGVQGFPTKVIITPESKIANITVGHDPSFFVVLNELLSK